MGRKVIFISYSDLQDKNQKLSDEMEKFKRKNRRLAADNEKEKVCREMDLEKEGERLRGVYQTQLEGELHKIHQEFQKIKSQINTEKNEFQGRTARCAIYLGNLIIR